MTEPSLPKEASLRKNPNIQVSQLHLSKTGSSKPKIKCPYCEHVIRSFQTIKTLQCTVCRKRFKNPRFYQIEKQERAAHARQFIKREPPLFYKHPLPPKEAWITETEP